MKVTVVYEFEDEFEYRDFTKERLKDSNTAIIVDDFRTDMRKVYKYDGDHDIFRGLPLDDDTKHTIAERLYGFFYEDE